MADSVSSKKKFNWTKPFHLKVKSIGRGGKGRPSTAESFGPSSPLDPSWEPQDVDDDPSDLHPAFPSSPRPPSTADSWVSSPKSIRTVFVPQPGEFKSAPFCPPSPTPSQLRFIPPSPPRPLKVLPPRSASLRPPPGGARKAKRAGSPRLKSPMTGGPLKPFGRKPTNSMLDAVLGVYVDHSDRPLTPPQTKPHRPRHQHQQSWGNPHPAVAPLYIPPSRPLSPLGPSPPPSPVIHLRHPRGRRKLASPPPADKKRVRPFGSKPANRVSNAIARSVSPSTSSLSAHSRGNSVGNSDSDIGGRRIDSTISAATTVPSRSSHASKLSRDDPISSIADEEFKKVMAEGKIRSRTCSNDSVGSQSSRMTSRSGVTQRTNATFGIISPVLHPSSSLSSPRSASSLFSVASNLPGPPTTSRAKHAASQSASAAETQVTHSVSIASLRSLGRAQGSDVPPGIHISIVGRKPSLPTILNTISLPSPSSSPDKEAAPHQESRPGPSFEAEMKSSEAGPSTRPQNLRTESTAAAIELAIASADESDAEVVLDTLLIQITNDEGEEEAVEVWATGVDAGDLSPAFSDRSEQSRKSTDSDLAGLLPLFRSPPMSPPFTPLASHISVPRHSFSLPPPSSSMYPPTPSSSTGHGFPEPAQHARHSIFGDYALPPKSPDSPSYDRERLGHPPASISPRSPSPGLMPEGGLRRPMSSSTRQKRASWRHSRDLPLLPPPTIPLPPPPTISATTPVSPMKTLPDLPPRAEEAPIPTPPTLPIAVPPTPRRPSDSPSSPAMRPLTLVLKYHPEPNLEPPLPSPTPPSLPTSPTSPSYSVNSDRDSRGFWERRGSTGGDSLLDLYSTAASFYSPPAERREESGMYFQPHGLWMGGRGEEVEVVQEDEQDESDAEEEGQFVDLPVRRRTDVVPPSAGRAWRGAGEVDVPPSPAFPFDA